jgi:hypothetical protein
MSDQLPISHEHWRSVERLVDGDCSDDDVAAIEQALRGNPTAQDLFLDYCQLHLDLSMEIRGEAAAENVLKQVAQKNLGEKSAPGYRAVRWERHAREVGPAVKKVWGRILHRPAVVFACGVLAAVLCYELWRPQGDDLAKSRLAPLAAERAEATAAVAPVARLTYTNGCSWGGSSPQFSTLDSQVRLGDEITLHEGIAEFRLSSGVSLSIEGPATLVMTSPTSLILQHGRMTVYVPPSVDDFRLVAASCRITARAAEFGVQIAGGDVDVHAFSGEILAAPTLLDERTAALEEPYGVKSEEDLAVGVDFSTATIAAGRGLALVSQGDATLIARWHPADETQFAPKLPMAGSLPITSSYVEAIINSQPMGYWRFEESINRLIDNEIGDLAGLVMSDDLRLVGDSGNRAVDLGRPGSNGALYCKNEVNLPPGSDYSVEVWMKPSHVHNGSIIGMITENPGEGKEGAALYLTISNMNSTAANTRQRVRFLHRDPPGGNSKTGTNCYSNIPYRLRRWQHVAAVKQGAEMRLYLDGVLVDTQHDESSLANHLRLIVGQLGSSPGVNPFIGQLDELAIYGRALSSKEVAKRYKLIDWEQQPASKRGIGRI